MLRDKGTMKNIKLGDAAVDGLLYGIAGGAAMAIYLVLVGLATGENPAVLLTRFDPNRASPLVGAVVHLAVSGVYGIVFGLLWFGAFKRFARVIPVWVFGVLYSVLLFLFGEYILLPRSVSPLLEIALWNFAIAHLIYGTVLGWLMERKMQGGDV